MKKLGGFIIVMGIVALVVTAAAWAQPGMGQGRGMGPGRGGGAAYGRIYNPQTVETVSGDVMSVETTTYGRRGYQGVHFTLKTGKETIPVHLGPAWYMDQQAVKVAQGDKVEVTGSRVDFQGKPAIIAAEVKKDGQVLKLRDTAGIPAWAGSGQGRRQR